jgi:hypothetical protein
MIAYGLLGAAGGLGLGIVAAILRTDGFGLALAGVGAGLGFVVGRFRVIRDVFLEQLPGGPMTLVVQLAALLATLVVGVLIWRALRGSDARRGLLTRPVPAAILVAVLALGWSLATRAMPGPPEPQHAQRGAAPANAPNIILLMVDTLRADRLGAYGYAKAKTPHIDSLATEGVRGARSFAQASWTRPSVATIFTALYPSSHGAIHKADILPDRVETIAEALTKGVASRTTSTSPPRSTSSRASTSSPTSRPSCSSGPTSRRRSSRSTTACAWCGSGSSRAA